MEKIQIKSEFLHCTRGHKLDLPIGISQIVQIDKVETVDSAFQFNLQAITFREYHLDFKLEIEGRQAPVIHLSQESVHSLPYYQLSRPQVFGPGLKFIVRGPECIWTIEAQRKN